MNRISVNVGFLFLYFTWDLNIIVAFPHLREHYDQFQEENLTTVQIIEKYGYPAETHTTETEDGYILIMHRIPHGKMSGIPGFPILLQHGMFSDSTCFVLSGPNSLAFLLSDAGYDVWLLNNRGNDYTRMHRNLSTKDNKFWDFSWHENGIYDLPAEIDYICDYTQNYNILYIGHSMGTTQYFVMASERPHYEKKIKAAFMMAPVAYLKHTTSRLHLLSPASDVTQALSKTFTHGELFKHNSAYQTISKKFCTLSFTARFICEYFIFLVSGFDSKEFDERTIKNFLGHLPSSLSTKTLVHYGQLINSGKFRQYDYGLIKNLAKYNQSTPPDYNLEAIKTPMAMFIAQNDVFVQPKDLVSLLERLSCVKTIDVVPYNKFSHLDFLSAIHAKELVHNKLLQRMDEFLKSNENISVK